MTFSRIYHAAVPLASPRFCNCKSKQSSSSHLFYWGLLGIPKMAGSVVTTVSPTVWFSHDDGVTIYVTIWWRALKAVLARDKTSVLHEMKPQAGVFPLFAQRPTRWKPSAWLRTKKVNAVSGCMPGLPNTGSAVPWNRPLHLVPNPSLITCL
jgi:predicted secreted protein